MSIRQRLAAGLVLVVSLLGMPALAQWTSNPLANTTIVARANDQVQPKIVPFPGGGWYVSWFDNVPPGGYDVYLQRLDQNGSPVWAAGGIRIADRTESSTEDYGLDVDPSGNAYLTFHDTRFANEQITATKVSPAGTQLWGPKGVQVTTDAAGKHNPKITVTSDGQVVVTWSTDTAMRIRRLDTNGVMVWDRTLTPPTGRSYANSDLHAADAGGVIFSWVRTISSTSARQLMAQKLTSAGQPPAGTSWPAAGLVVYDGGSLQMGAFPTFVSDAAGGAVFAWYNRDPQQVYAQHVTSTGVEAFGHNGAAVSTDSAYSRAEPAVSWDAATGMTYVYWNEFYNTTGGLYGQKLNGTGVSQWAPTGVVVRPLQPSLSVHHIATVQNGGNTLVYWMEEPGYFQTQLFASKRDTNGAALCSTFGVSTYVTSKSRTAPAIDLSSGMSVVIFEDSRNGDPDLFGQNVNADCSLGITGLPKEVSGPGAITPLHFTSRVDLAWEDKSLSGSDTFDLYRGDTTVLPSGDSGACLQSGLFYSQATDSSAPGTTHSYFYLVGGRNTHGAGTLGNASNGNPRVAGTPCP